MASTDVAELMLKIDSSQLLRANQHLDDFVSSAELAEAEAKQMGIVTEAVFEQLERDMAMIDNRAAVFDDFDVSVPRIHAVEDALNRLLRHGVSPNADAVQLLKTQYEQLSEGAQQVNKGLGKQTFLLQNIGYLVQDAPYAALSGNMGAIANNIPMVTQGFQGLIAAEGGVLAATKSLLASFVSPGGLIIMLSSVLPAAIVAAQSGLFDFGEETESAEDKVDSLTQTIEQYLSVTARMRGESVFDPLGVDTAQREIEGIQQLRVATQDLFALQRRQADLQQSINNLRQAGTVSTLSAIETLGNQRAALQGVNHQLEIQQSRLGSLADINQEMLDQMQRERQEQIDRFEILSRINPALEFQAAINGELSDAIRDVALGLEGAEPRLRSLIISYDQQIESIRGAIESHQGEARELETLKQILDTLIQSRDNATQAIDRHSNAIEGINEELEEQVRLLLALRTGAALYLDELKSVADVQLSDPMEFLSIDMRVIDELEERFKIIENSARVFSGFDANAAKIRAVEGAMKTLLEEGVRPNDIAMQILIQRYNELQDESADLKNATDHVNKSARQLGFTFSSAFEDAIISGRSLGDVLKGLLQDIQRIILRSQVTEPLGNAFSSWIGGGNLFGVGQAGWTGAGNSMFGGTTQIADALITKDGKIIQGHPNDNWLAYQGDRLPVGNGANVTVNVINNNGSEVRTQQRRTSDGGIEIGVLIDNRVKESLSSGRFDEDFASNFNLNRSGF